MTSTLPCLERADCSTRVICHCLQVTEETVVDALASLGVTTLRELRQHTGAGDGCTACHHVLRQYLKDYASAVPICSVK